MVHCFVNVKGVKRVIDPWKLLGNNCEEFKKIQGTLVPKLILGPFLTLGVRNGHKLKDWVFGSRSISRVKVENKNYNQHFIKHDEDNNYQFKTFLNQNYNRSSFYNKALDCFQDNIRFPIFENILNLKHCRVFEKKKHFSRFEYNPQFKTKLTFITYKINH